MQPPASIRTQTDELLKYTCRQILMKHLRAPRRILAPGYPAARPKEASAVKTNYTKLLAGPVNEARPAVVNLQITRIIHTRKAAEQDTITGKGQWNCQNGGFLAAVCKGAPVAAARPLWLSRGRPSWAATAGTEAGEALLLCGALCAVISTDSRRSPCCRGANRRACSARSVGRSTQEPRPTLSQGRHCNCRQPR